MESKARLSISEEWLKEKLKIFEYMLYILFDNQIIIETVASTNENPEFYRIINCKNEILYCNILKSDILECDDEMAYKRFWEIIYFIQEKNESKESRW